MLKGFKYRLYPTKAQILALEQILETHRRIYNMALSWRRNAFTNEQKSVRYSEQSAQFALDRSAEHRLSQVNFSSCQHTLRRLERAFQNFFRRVKAGGKPGYPRFKGVGRFDSVKFTYGDGCKAKDREVYIQHVGNIKVKLHRDIPKEARITSATVSTKAGMWYVSFACELPDVPVAVSTNPPVGIDLGLKSFLVTSDGDSVDPPRFFVKAQKKLRIAQRSLSRKKRGSRRRKKAVIAVARLHHHVGNQRRDFHHKTALSLVSRHGLIAHEDLSINGLSRSMLAKSVNDAGWGNFLNILRFKAECAGVEVVGVDPRYTTQTCSSCGNIPAKKVTLSVRVYHCNSCGLVMCRDQNAARNILKSAWTVPSGANVEAVSSCVA